MSSTLVLGGPGCGKTTYLLARVAEALAAGVPPARIAFVAFTRRAAAEARARAAEAHGLDDLPYFRTLHSLAFRMLGVQPGQIMDSTRLREYARAEGLLLADDGDRRATHDDWAFAALALARATETPLADVCADRHVDFAAATRIARRYREYKDAECVVDFDDLLAHYADAPPDLPLDLLIVDEAQDLSALQWRMVDAMAAQAATVYYAGDDDQAIYRFAGADVRRFLTLDTDHRVVLPRSYRLPAAVHTACERVIGEVRERYRKRWRADRDGGELSWIGRLDDVDLSTGTWYLLARTRFGLRRLRRHCRLHGYVYRYAARDSTREPAIRAALAYRALQDGDTISGATVSVLAAFLDGLDDRYADDQPYSALDLGIDVTPPWDDALDVPEDDRQYLRAVLARGIEESRITVATIHAVKGGEADHVVLDTSLTRRPDGAWQDRHDDEYRTLYVALSRARESVYLLAARGRRKYTIDTLLGDAHDLLRQ